MMEVKTYTKNEMIEMLKKYKKQVSFRRLEDLAGVRHGCIGNFVYRGGKMPQERFRKIRRAWFGELQRQEMEKIKSLYAKHEPAKKYKNMVVCGAIDENYFKDPESSFVKDFMKQCEIESDKRLMEKLTKDCVVVDLSPWYEKLWLKIKTFVAKLFLRKTK